MTLTMQVSDDYIGSDGTMEGRTLDNGLGGSATLNWSHAVGSGWALASNQAIAGGAGFIQILNVYNAVDATDGRVSMRSLKGGTGVIARYENATGKFYLYLRVATDDLGYLYYYDGAAYTQRTVGTHVIADTDWLRIVPHGTTVDCYVNNTLDISGAVASEVASGKPGLWAYEVSSSGHGATGFTYETGTLSATATQLAVATQPAGNQSGVALTTQPVVEVRDAGGTLVTSDTSTVTVALITVSGSGTLLGTSTKAAVAGSAAFTGLGVTGAGSFKYRFTDGSLASVDSAVFYVGATQLVFTSPPTTFLTDRDIVVVVTAKDANSVTVGNYTGTVTLTPTADLIGFTKKTGAYSASAVAGVATITFAGQFQTGTTLTLAAAASGLTAPTPTTLVGTVRSPDIPFTVT